MYIPQSLLTDGEACLLVAIFEHLKKYSERAETKGTSVADELSECTEDISQYAEAVRHAIANCLDDREYEIILKRYGLPPYKKCSTREEVAQNFGVTRERIRQIEAKALQKIKRFLIKLNDEEVSAAISALKNERANQMVHASRAEEQGDYTSMDVYMHNWQACNNAASKLKIQQDIRKWERSAQ